MIPKTPRKRFAGGSPMEMTIPLRCRICNRLLKTTPQFKGGGYREVCPNCMKGRKG